MLLLLALLGAPGCIATRGLFAVSRDLERGHGALLRRAATATLLVVGLPVTGAFDIATAPFQRLGLEIQQNIETGLERMPAKDDRDDER